MSWHQTFENLEAFQRGMPTSEGGMLSETSFREHITNLATDPDARMIIEVHNAMMQQVGTARLAAELILESPSVIDEDGGGVRVQLSGHANPFHKPRQGWANDTITVTVTRIGQRRVAHDVR